MLTVMAAPAIVLPIVSSISPPILPAAIVPLPIPVAVIAVLPMRSRPAAASPLRLRPIPKGIRMLMRMALPPRTRIPVMVEARLRHDHRRWRNIDRRLVIRIIGIGPAVRRRSVRISSVRVIITAGYLGTDRCRVIHAVGIIRQCHAAL